MRGAHWAVLIGILFRSPIDRIRIEATVMAASSVNFFPSFLLVSPVRERRSGGINTSAAHDWLISIAFSDLDPGLTRWRIVYACGNYANSVYNKFFASFTRTNALDYSLFYCD